MAIDHDGSQIAALMRPYHIRLLEAAAADADQTLGIDISFDLESVEVQDVLDLLATKVKAVAETTKEQIRRITGEAARDGHGNDWIAEQIGALKDMTADRAMLIARTESAAAYSRGSLLRYEQSGQVSGTEWLLGPEPCDICQPLGGTVAALGETFADGIDSPPAHPRCTCALAPVLT